MGIGVQADAICTQLGRLATARALTTSVDPAAPALGPILGTTLQPAEQQTFIERDLAHDGPISDFWTQITAGCGAQKAAALQEMMQLSVIAQNHAPMVARLQQLRASGALARVQDVVRYTEDDWRGLIVAGPGATGVPDGVPGGTLEEQQQTYAAIL